MAGIVTCWNAFYIGASRTVYAMSREGLLPAWFGKIHPKYRTPSRAILLIMVLTTAAPFFGATVLKWAANAGSFATVVTYLLVSVSYLRLRLREPDMPRPYSAAPVAARRGRFPPAQRRHACGLSPGLPRIAQLAL